MPKPILYGLLASIGLLLIGWVTTLFMYHRRPTPELVQVKLRIRSWLYIWSVFAALFVLPAPVVAVIFGGLAVQVVWEIISSFRPLSPKNRASIVLAWGIGVLAAVALCGGYLLWRKDVSAFFFVVVLTQLNDVFQYLWGKSCGKHAMLPTISPAKTWEGFLGGVVTSACVAYAAAPYFVAIHGGKALLLGGCLAVGGFAGDASFSALKRQLKVKDLGTLLPGHGGLSDRLDSLLYVLLVAALLWRG